MLRMLLSLLSVLLFVAPACAQIAPPLCSNWFAPPELQIAVPPDGQTAGPVVVQWKLDDIELEQTGKEIHLEVPSAEGSSHSLTATSSSGAVLCGATVYLHIGRSPELRPLGSRSAEQLEILRRVADARALEQTRENAEHAEAVASAAAERARGSQEAADAAREEAGAAAAKRQSEQRAGMTEFERQLDEKTIHLDAKAQADLATSFTQLAIAEQLRTEAQSLAIGAPPAPMATGPVQPPHDAAAITVYYATERAESVPGSYLNVRDGDRNIHYGKFTVYVPTSHKRLWIGDPAYWTYRKSDFSADAPTLFTPDTFYGDLRSAVAAHEHNLLIFVHGYNNGFMEDIYKAAQLAYDTGLRGQVLMWDWPSQGEFRDYGPDRRMIDGSQSDLAGFLKDIRRNSGADKVNVVAHSMGCRLLLQTLYALQQTDDVPYLAQVVLAAPDVDESTFLGKTPAVLQSGHIHRLTLYGSRKDLAMRASVVANMGRVPVGMLSQPIVLGGFDQIDATALPMNVLGHDYFLTTRAVLDDMGKVLQIDAAMPPGRDNLYANGQGRWRFLR